MNYQSKLIKEYEDSGYMVVKLIRCNINGMPDLMILKDGVTEFIEVKEANDTLKPLQRLRIKQLQKKGFSACCMQEGKGVIY